VTVPFELERPHFTVSTCESGVFLSSQPRPIPRGGASESTNFWAPLHMPMHTVWQTATKFSTIIKLDRRKNCTVSTTSCGRGIWVCLHWDWNWCSFAWRYFLFLLAVTMNGDKMTMGWIWSVVEYCGWRCSKGAEFCDYAALHSNTTNKLCGRPPQYAPAPWKLTFDLLTFIVVSESRACDVGYLCSNSSLPAGPLCSRLRPDVRDRHRPTTDVRQTSDAYHSLMPPTLGAWA